ncbi:hypothetical protein G7046_g3262 [Stylonectria norvegica]|nr:hypothetical protein G7046_g3262 [Stylonectria norvegica]
MRLPFRQGRSTARQAHKLSSSIVALAALAPSFSHAITFNPVPSPNLDFSSWGKLALPEISTAFLYTRQLPNGALASIVSTDASIRTMCMFKLSNGDMQGVVIGGNFTSLDGTQSTAIALFNPNTTEVTPLEGLEGEVNAVLCDQERNTVYVGGNFKGANSTNAIAWVGTEGWTNLPFAGFNGPVKDITKASNGHIIFGGVFTGLGNTSTPSQPDGQSINLSTANISAQNSASSSGFKDPKNIVCSSDNSAWLLQDDTPGFWEAEFGFGFEPTKLRLRNTGQDGRGTKTFRFLAYPINGIMNLTYVDPATGQNTTCTSECPLNSTSDGFQDFHFVNRVGMNRFRIAISDWYGSGGGLSGIELFQDDIFAYAIAGFNEPACGDIEFPATATKTGPWAQAPSLESNSNYLTANLSGDIKPKSASVVFFPNIRESGNYSVNMYTPGCKPDETCSARGRVNVTGVMSTGTINANFSIPLYQTNNFDKYDQIYFGYIEKTSDAFKPSVTLTPLAGQDVKTLTIVAQKVGFALINSTGGLNGLFDFNPEQAVVNVSSLMDSAVNRLGASFDRNSGVTSLVTAGDVTYVGGNFTSTDHENIIAINTNEDVMSLDGGLNGQVFDMYLDDTKLYVGGEFSNTQTSAIDGMDNIAVYDTKENTWKAIGAGVDGKVEYVVPLRMNITKDTPEIVVTFTGVFTTCKAFSNSSAISADGFAVWVPSQSNWLQNIEGTFPLYSGLLTAALLDLPDGDAIYAGSISSAQLGIYGAVTLSDDGLGQFPVKIQAQSTSSSSSKTTRRDIIPVEEVSGVVAGIFYDDDDHNITVLAGHFTAETSNGTEVSNLVLIDGDDVLGLGSEVSSDSTFVTVAIRDNILFAGGKISGSINKNDVNGLVSYDLNSKSFNTQPASISGGNGTVSAIAVQPDSADVYVGGSFKTAGALECPGLCTYNVDSSQWTRPGNDLQGDVYSLMWSSKTDLVVGGDLGANGSDPKYLSTWNAKKETWADFPGSDGIPGPVQVISPASSKGDEFWIAGTSSDDSSTYLMKYDGDKWLTAKLSLSSGTVVRGLQVFSVTKDHDKTDLLDQKQVLMLTGSIVVPGFGVAAAAIFNGTAYQPYALTSNSGSSPGSIARIFSQKNNFFSSSTKHMPLVFVILIGLAVSLGLMLLLVLGGIILDRLRKKREGYAPAPTSMYDRGSGIQRIPPHELLESLGQGRTGAPHVYGIPVRDFADNSERI